MPLDAAGRWAKSSLSESGNCGEVRQTFNGVEVRDSKNPDAVVALSDAEWAAFIAGVKNGEFDLP